MNPSSKKPTINDLAKALGTSPSTVSRALKNHPKISEETKIKVQKAAIKLGYVNSIQATIQQSFNQEIIGIIVPDLKQAKNSNMVEAARKKIEMAGYHPIILCSSDSSNQEKSLFDLLLSLNVKGVLASITYEAQKPEHIEDFILNKPVVLFDRISYKLPCNKIMIDHFQAGHRAVQHLLNNQCKKIAHFGGNIQCPLVKQISTGYKTALRNAGIKTNPSFELFSDYIMDDLMKMTEMVFSHNEKPDAILLDDIQAAQRLISILHARKILVPDDIAIMAIGDESDYLLYSPSITTIELPYQKMGETAAKTLIGLINKDHKIKSESIIVEPFNLNIRNSTLKN